jgi:hypothetical protein
MPDYGPQVEAEPGGGIFHGFPRSGPLRSLPVELPLVHEQVVVKAKLDLGSRFGGKRASAAVRPADSGRHPTKVGKRAQRHFDQPYNSSSTATSIPRLRISRQR